MGYIEAYGSKCTLRTAFGTWVFEATTYKGRDASLRTGIPGLCQDMLLVKKAWCHTI